MTAFYCQKEKHQGKHICNRFILYSQTCEMSSVHAVDKMQLVDLGGGKEGFYPTLLNKLSLRLGLFFY